MVVNMNTITLTEKNLDEIIRSKVVGIMSEVMSDPDFGMELQDWVKKRLKQKPRKSISSPKIKQKYL
jgi:hypothetical protein